MSVSERVVDRRRVEPVTAGRPAPGVWRRRTPPTRCSGCGAPSRLWRLSWRPSERLSSTSRKRWLRCQDVGWCRIADSCRGCPRATRLAQSGLRSAGRRRARAIFRIRALCLPGGAGGGPRGKQKGNPTRSGGGGPACHASDHGRLTRNCRSMSPRASGVRGVTVIRFRGAGDGDGVPLRPRSFWRLGRGPRSHAGGPLRPARAVWRLGRGGSGTGPLHCTAPPARGGPPPRSSSCRSHLLRPGALGARRRPGLIWCSTWSWTRTWM